MARTFFPRENLLSPTTMISSVLTTTESLKQASSLAPCCPPSFLLTSRGTRRPFTLATTLHQNAAAPERAREHAVHPHLGHGSGGRCRCCRPTQADADPGRPPLHSACSGVGSEGHLLRNCRCTLPQQQTWDHCPKHVSEFTFVNFFQSIRNVNFI